MRSAEPRPSQSSAAECRHWAAFPGKDTAGLLGNKADLTPDNETLIPNANRPADCFFVHPCEL